MKFFDKLSSLVTGMGVGGKDRQEAMGFVNTTLQKAEIDAMYRSDWLARKIVDTIPFDMTREWINWIAEEDIITKLEEAETELLVADKVRLALIKSRLHGGALIYVGIKGTVDPSLPLDPDTIREGQIDYLHVLDRYELSTGEIDRDIMSKTFNQPSYYQISGTTGSASVKIHPSRAVRFLGAALPDNNLGAENDYWGDSILQAMYDTIRNAASVHQHVAALVPEAKLDVIRVPGLSDALATDEGTAAVMKRFSTANQIKSLYSMLLIEGDGDSGETWEQKQIRFTEFPDLMDRFMQVASGAGDYPLTRLLGQSPRGLNATGESDTRNYYDHVKSCQKNDLKPALDPLMNMVIRHAGVDPKDAYYEFQPLWQVSEKELADIGKVQADTDHVYATDAVVPSPVLEQAIRNRLIESGNYPGIEQAYEDWDAGLLGGDPNSTIDPTTGQPIEKAPVFDPATGLSIDPDTGLPIKPDQNAGPNNVVPFAKAATGDAEPRSMYVCRKVTNAAAIIKWAHDQGFETTLAASDMHVTLAFSRQPVDWFKVYTADAKVEIPAGGPRAVERLGEDGAIVLLFSSDTLHWRWQHFKGIGAEWTYGDDYQPHVTITYKAKDDLDLSTIQPYTGPIELGPELFAEVESGQSTREEV